MMKIVSVYNIFIHVLYSLYFCMIEKEEGKEKFTDKKNKKRKVDYVVGKRKVK